MLWQHLLALKNPQCIMEKTCGHAALLDVNLVMRPYHLFRKAWSTPMRKRAAMQCCRISNWCSYQTIDFENLQAYQGKASAMQRCLIPIRCCYQIIHLERLQAYPGESLGHAVLPTVIPVLLPYTRRTCIFSEHWESDECTIQALANYRRCYRVS